MSGWSSGYVTDLGYTHGFYRELTPLLLDLVALSKGLRAPGAQERLTYCELGCGQGVSANVLAAANPHIEFHATDFNPAQIAGARALAQAGGATNIHFYEDSFAEFLERPGLPDFDIISLHGIYSWIAPEHRATIVEIARRKLKPGGLLYNSYNALPGWSAAAPMRHLLYLHGKMQGGPTGSRLDPALAFLGALEGAQAKYFANNPVLKERLQKLKGQNRNYLAHEYMNDAWTLLYHSDVAAEMSNAKLAFIGSANLLDHIDVINLTPEQQQVMAGVPDPVLRETVRDYIVNQQFRRDVFAKGTVPYSLNEGRQAWLARSFVLSVPQNKVSFKVNASRGEAVLQPEIYQPLVDAFAKGPQTVAELLATEAIKKQGWARLREALILLVGSGQLQPCLPQAGYGERVKRTRAFNAAVCKRAEDSTDLQFLASPVTGGGIQLDRFGQIFLAAGIAKMSDPVGHAWSLLEGLGQRIMKDGKALDTREENLDHLRTLHADFLSQRLPLLKQLGIA